MTLTPDPRLTAALVAIMTCAAWAGSQAGDQAEKNPLAGPSVDAEAEEETLAGRGYDGRLTPLDAVPEIAALDLLPLDEDDWDAINPILEHRAAIIDKVVVAHISTLVELQSAIASGDKAAQREYFGQIVDDLLDLRRSGRLVDQLARVLPEEVRADYKRLVRERQMARFEDLRVDAEREGVEHPDSEAFRRLIIETLGQEIQRSYDRIAIQGQERLEEIIQALELDLQTEGEIRRLANEFGQRTLLNPTPAQRRAFFADVYRALPQEARTRLLAMFSEDVGG